MSLVSFSLRRPVATIAFIILFVIAGINSYRKLEHENMPQVEIPFVTITTTYPGAGPKEIEAAVTKNIEDAVSGVSGVKHMYSTCMQNIAQTLVEFQMEMDIDVVATEVREKIDLIIDNLPEEAEQPQILKVNVNAKPVANFILVGTQSLDELYDYADEILSDKLALAPGVAEVQIVGGEELELQVILDGEKLSSHNLTIAQILDILRKRNAKIPAGTLLNESQEVNVTFAGNFRGLEEVRNLELTLSSSRSIRLRDVAQVSLAAKETRNLAFYDGRPAIDLKIVKKDDANAVKVVQHIREIVRKTRPLLPGGMELIWFNDDADFIAASLYDARNNIFLGIALTSLILFAFLQEIRSVFIISLTMPISVIISLFFIHFFGFTLNMITLLALGTSVGILVANSIVVIEHIFKRLEAGDNPKEAALSGTHSILVTVVASAGTNIIVFVPVAFMSGLVGRFFYPFAISMVIVTLVSLVISFTLTPILAAKLLRQNMPKPSFFMRGYQFVWNLLYGKTLRFYLRSLRFCAKAPLFFLFLGFLGLVLTLVYIAPLVGMSFFPNNDRGEFLVKIEYPTDYNIKKSAERTLIAAQRIRSLPEVKRTVSLIGKVQGVMGKVNQGVHLAEISVITSRKDERNQTMTQMRELMRQEFLNDTDCIVGVNVTSVVGGSETDIELEVTGYDFKTLDQIGDSMVNIATESGMLVDMESTVRIGKTEIQILPHRELLHDYGISEELLGLMIRGNIEGIKVGSYRIGARSLDIRVQLEHKEGLEQLRNFSLMSKEGKPISIEAIAYFEKQKIPIQIVRAEKQRSVKLFANMAPGAALSDAIEYLNKHIQAILPPGYEMNYVGRVEKMGEAQVSFAEAFLTASLLLYLLIAAIMESWTQPFIIMTTLPMALIGLFLMLFIMNTTMSLMGMLGTMILIGIAVNDAILIMENVKMLRDQGTPTKEAMFASVEEKFRSVIMTSLAAILGIAPMAFGQGLGCEIRNSCGITVIGGLISSTVLTLYFVPLIYIRFNRKS